ncbi:hypothetical protein CH330_06575 [candidate division WOR-3 bacterium JGI_Cruoil_03_51_56]|uniref:Nucleoid-associated protein CH330_06575 n=1 Tax=candidate division WOR-3 bacterium JGI_Cruoil_03_51_56 TaxID=1973747 RepID=A0A235BSC5_UNCW3|nr:MAG: hypothetical protein CH330_06575 [candidate division WOR-3 bacterium JGI_Cruoil_03_51_56]
MDPNSDAIFSQLAELQKKIREKLQGLKVSSTAGGGMVKVECDGYGNILKLQIEPEVVDKKDVELLEDLIKAAVNEARSRSRKQATEEMQKLIGIPFPDIMGGLPV